jgi:hypothetical protein
MECEPLLQLESTNAIAMMKAGAMAQITARLDMAEPRTGRLGTQKAQGRVHEFSSIFHAFPAIGFVSYC